MEELSAKSRAHCEIGPLVVCEEAQGTATVR